MLELQILSAHFRLLQIHGNWQFTSVIVVIASAEEENTDAATYADEEDELLWTNLEIQMEAAVEVAKFFDRGMKEAAEEAEVKAAASKSTAFLLFLVGVCTDRCTMF